MRSAGIGVQTAGFLLSLLGASRQPHSIATRGFTDLRQASVAWLVKGGGTARVVLAPVKWCGQAAICLVLAKRSLPEQQNVLRIYVLG